MIPGNGSNSEETYSLLCSYAHQGAYFSLGCEVKKREQTSFLDKMEVCALLNSAAFVFAQTIGKAYSDLRVNYILENKGVYLESPGFSESFLSNFESKGTNSMVDHNLEY